MPVSWVGIPRRFRWSNCPPNIADLSDIEQTKTQLLEFLESAYEAGADAAGWGGN